MANGYYTKARAGIGMESHGIQRNDATRWIYVSGMLIISLLSIAVILLLIQNNALRTQLQRSGRAAILTGITPGDRLQGFEARTIEGQATRIDYDDTSGQYLLFILSTTCPYCEANLVKWNVINATCQAEGCFVVGVSIHNLEMTRRYFEEKRIAFYTVVNDREEFQEAYKVSGVPITILLTYEGYVRNVWKGQLTDSTVAEIIAEIKPGV